MNSDFNTIETLARRLAAERGCGYDRKGAKRAYWRKKAEMVHRVVARAKEPSPWMTGAAIAPYLVDGRPWWRRPLWRWFA